jgi:glycosyltransferase involved in cell wall biosynthesis
MRVLVVHSRYRSTAPSGENAVVDQEAAALREAGVEVHRFERSSDDIATWPLTRTAGLPLRSIYDTGVRDDLAEVLARLRPDVVHIHNTFPLLSPSVLDACAGAGVPVVATLHNYKLLCASGDFFRDGRPCHDCADGGWGPALRHGCYRGSRLATVPVVAGLAANRRRWHRLVSAFVFISAAQRDLMVGLGLPADRTYIRHNFVPERPAVAGPREHVVSYVGRLDAAKGLPLLIEAWDAFRQRSPSARLRLVVVGGGPLEDRLVQWAAGRDDVDVRGLLSREAAAAAISRSLAVLVPSAWEETFGLVAVEAMAAGVAPVAPSRGSFPELIRDGVDGLLVTPGDPEALSKALQDIDTSPDRWVEMGRAGRSAFPARFGTERGITELLSIYERAIGHPAAVARR